MEQFKIGDLVEVHNYKGDNIKRMYVIIQAPQRLNSSWHLAYSLPLNRLVDISLIVGNPYFKKIA